MSGPWHVQSFSYRAFYSSVATKQYSDSSLGRYSKRTMSKFGTTIDQYMHAQWSRCRTEGCSPRARTREASKEPRPTDGFIVWQLRITLGPRTRSSRHRCLPRLDRSSGRLRPNRDLSRGCGSPRSRSRKTGSHHSEDRTRFETESVSNQHLNIDFTSLLIPPWVRTPFAELHVCWFDGPCLRLGAW